jgi:hypothetical protein
MNHPINITEAVRLVNEANKHNLHSNDKIVIYENAIQTLLDAVDRIEDMKKIEMETAMAFARKKLTPSKQP